MTTLKMWADGACRGNPGPSSYGVVAVLPNNNRESRCEPIGEMTNNQAEYHACIAAGKLAQHIVKRNNIKLVELRMDSLLVVSQMRDEWECRDEHLNELRSIARAEWSMVKCDVVFIHVRRHLNTDADELANYALDSLDWSVAYDRYQRRR